MRRLAIAAAVVAVGLSGTGVAGAADALEFELPSRWNTDYSPGARCGTPGENGTYVEATRHWFKQTDAASVANFNDEPVPVTHTVTQKRTETTEVSASAKDKGELAKFVSNAFGFTYVNQIYWKFKQVVGPYTLPPQTQGRLVWGFSMLDTDNQDVTCGEDQTWHAVGAPYTASFPEAKYSELRIDEPDFEVD